MHDHYDLIVIGAGPAGCRAASIAVKKRPDWSVLLLDHLPTADWQRYHGICAEGISGKGLDELGEWARKYIIHQLKKVEERWPAGIVVESDIDGYIVDRRGIMRHQLEEFQAGGGEVLDTGAVDVRNSPEINRVLTKDNMIVTSRFLIGADGGSSMVRRRVFRTETETLVPVTQYETRSGGKPSTLLLEYGARYKGKYRWTFPSLDGYKIGYPTGSDAPASSKVKLSGRSIPVGMVSSLVNGTTALIGDAAGMANPVTYAGLRNSWTSARMAVEAMVEGDLLQFEREWRESPLADPAFLEAHRLLRTLDDDALAKLASPLRYGPNMWAIIDGLIKTPGFPAFYRAHMRKLAFGW